MFQSIDLFDWIDLEKADKTTVSCNLSYIPCNEKNICIKAAAAFNNVHKTGGVKINIKKTIPVSAGLGGGSADAAAVIMGLNALYDCELTPAELIKIGQSVGADVPFFMLGGCARAQGIGEILTSVHNSFDYDIVVIKPNTGISTPKAYQLFDQTESIGGSAELMLDALNRADETAYIREMQNALQPCAFRLAPGSKKAADALSEAGALKAMVSGSGAAVFGLFKKNEGKNARQRIVKKGFKQVFLTRKTDNGIVTVQGLSAL